MIEQKRMLMGILGTILIAGCDGSQTKTSQADQTELTQLREEKKIWKSEKAKMQESLDWRENKKNEVIAELGKVKDELAQEKQKNSRLEENLKGAKKQ